MLITEGRLQGLNTVDRQKLYFARKQREAIQDANDIKRTNRNIFRFIDKIMDSVSKGKLSIETGSMYVIKYDPRNMYTKGEKTFNLDKDFISSGGTFREIIFIKDKELRERLNELSKMMEFNAEGQYGFLTGFDITNNALHHSSNPELTLVSNFDLEGAFNQIKDQEIFGVFRYIFDLNPISAKFITELATINGFCYQGSPISPILFNILSINLINNLKRAVFKDNEALGVSGYADDFTISFKGMKFLPKRKMLYYVKIIESKGWKVNPDKIVSYNVKNNGSRAEITGINLFNKDGGFILRPCNVRTLKKKIKLFNILKNKGIKNSFKLDKKGKPITVKQLLAGLEGWLYRIEFSDSKSRLNFTKTSNAFVGTNIPQFHNIIKGIRSKEQLSFI